MSWTWRESKDTRSLIHIVKNDLHVTKSKHISLRIWLNWCYQSSRTFRLRVMHKTNYSWLTDENLSHVLSLTVFHSKMFARCLTTSAHWFQCWEIIFSRMKNIIDKWIFQKRNSNQSNYTLDKVSSLRKIENSTVYFVNNKFILFLFFYTGKAHDSHVESRIFLCLSFIILRKTNRASVVRPVDHTKH